MNINQVMLVGRITHTPEIKSTTSGTKVTSITVVTNRVWNDKDGNKQESAEFIDCIAFGKTAEIMCKFLEGGQEVSVIGRIQTRTWQKEGEATKRYKTEIIIGNIQFGAKSQARAERKAGEKTADAPKQDAPTMPDYPEEDINPEDIPF